MDNTIEITFVESKIEIAECWEVASELRSHLNENNFVNDVLELMSDKYQIIVIKEDNKVVSFAGFRPLRFLNSGPIIYIDDLCTLENYRQKGYGTALLNYIKDLAIKSGKTSVHLDSGYFRLDAHKLYFKNNFKQNAYHFSLEV
jgi:GNAT superfamily N-acetyltransferase